LWRADAHPRLHHAQRRHPSNTGPHRGVDGATAQRAGTRAAAVGPVPGRCAADLHWCRCGAALGRCSTAGTRL
jgi:hypothetical protein